MQYLLPFANVLVCITCLCLYVSFIDIVNCSSYKMSSSSDISNYFTILILYLKVKDFNRQYFISSDMIILWISPNPVQVTVAIKHVKWDMGHSLLIGMFTFDLGPLYSLQVKVIHVSTLNISLIGANIDIAIKQEVLYVLWLILKVKGQGHSHFNYEFVEMMTDGATGAISRREHLLSTIYCAMVFRRPWPFYSK